MALTPLTEARQLLSDLVGDLVTGTATGAGTADGTTLVDSGLTPLSGNQDDYYTNQWVIITSGTALGEELRVSDFTASTGTLTFYGVGASVQIASGVTYEIHKLWRALEKRRALNWAIREAYPYLARNIVDTAILTQQNVYSYRLGDYGSGAAVTYAAAALTHTGKAWQTNQFAGYRVESGGSSASVASNTATVLTLSANWSPTTPTAGDAYSILHPIRDLYTVEFELNEDVASYPYQPLPFGTREHDGTRDLQFSPGWLPPASRTLRLLGRGYLSAFTSTETSTIEAEQSEIDPLLYLAAHFLFRRTPSMVASTDRDFYREESNRYLTLWEGWKRTHGVKRYPKKVWVPGMGGGGATPDLSQLAIMDTPVVA